MELGNQRAGLGFAQLQRVAVRAGRNDADGGTVEPGVETVFREQSTPGFSGFEDRDMRCVIQRFIDDRPKRH